MFFPAHLVASTRHVSHVNMLYTGWSCEIQDRFSRTYYCLTGIKLNIFLELILCNKSLNIYQLYMRECLFREAMCDIVTSCSALTQFQFDFRVIC